jgi:hypothetical protein
MDEPSSSLKRPGTDVVIEGSPDKRRPVTLETISYDDFDHERLDKAVLQSSSAFTFSNSMTTIIGDLLKTAPDSDPAVAILLASLLSCIVEHSLGRLDSKYTHGQDALGLLKQYPDLLDLLKEAWKERKFKAIRNLSALS